MNITFAPQLTEDQQDIETAKRLVEQHPKESHTFPHLLLPHRISLLAELLKTARGRN